MAVSEHPDIVIVCDHQIRGGQLDPVARFEWGQHGWYLPLQFTAAALRPLKGDKPAQAHLGDEPTRTHYEIPCQKCRRAYRSDESNLQTLFDAIANNQKFRDVFTVSATDTAITITLDALHYARHTAKQHGLHV